MESSERKAGVRLFGVLIGGGVSGEEKDGKEQEYAGEEMIRKSQSMNNLAAAADPAAENAAVERGYLSEGGLRKSGRRRRRTVLDRKKGVPWTEEEHRTFLEGLEKLGKGDWRGISRKFVLTRTPTQVASHAQKYFIRQTAATGRRRRRSSLFDATFVTADNVSTSGVQKGSVEQLTEMVKEKGSMEKSTVIEEEDLLRMNLGVGGDGPIGPSCGLPGIDLQRRALARLIM